MGVERHLLLPVDSLPCRARWVVREMRTIGLLGGMSWESTQTYYAQINRQVNNRLGGLHSAKIIMVSVDFSEIEQQQITGDWNSAAIMLSDAARQLELAGADCFAICTNTMHEVFEQVSEAVQIPGLHIVDAVGRFAHKQNYHHLGLLGTRFTMERDFFRQRLLAKHNVRVIVPSHEMRSDIHRIIYKELCLGEVRGESRDVFLAAMHELTTQKIDGVILGCTEIGMLIQQSHTRVPILDTTVLHAQALVEFALNQEA